MMTGQSVHHLIGDDNDNDKADDENDDGDSIRLCYHIIMSQRNLILISSSCLTLRLAE